MTSKKQKQESAASLLRSWFQLTQMEQRALIVIVALFLLGLIVRHWHREKSQVDSCLVQDIVMTSERK